MEHYKLCFGEVIVNNDYNFYKRFMVDVINDPEDDFLSTCTYRHTLEVLAPGYTGVDRNYQLEISQRQVEGSTHIHSMDCGIDISEPGSIYIYSSITRLRSCAPYHRLLIRSLHKDRKTALDMTINLRELGYSIDPADPALRDVDIAYLVAYPGPEGPGSIIKPDHMLRDYLKSLKYTISK